MSEFDVLLSFAGAEREYARAIFDIAKANGVTVFFDESYQHEIWGKNLVEYLDRTYRERGMYVLILISAAYKERAYTRVERRAAFDRMIESAGEYVLPVMVDGTWLEGIPKATGYLDLRTHGVLGICRLLVQKVKNSPTCELVVPPDRTNLQRQERLTEALRSGNPMDRHYAVRAIGQQAVASPDSATPEVLFVLQDALRDTDPTVSREAAEFLGRLGPAAGKAAPALIAVLANPHPVVRESAAKALGSIGAAAAAIPHLVKALNDGDARVREAAADTLGSFGPAAAEAIPALVIAVDDAQLRSHAEAALRSIGPAPASALPELCTALASLSPNIRTKAAEEIGYAVSPTTASMDALLVALGDTEESVAGKAEAALVKIGPSAETQLVAALRDRKFPIRVCRILGRIGIASPDVLTALSELLTVPDLALQKEAALAFAMFGPAASRILPQLLGLLTAALPLAQSQPPAEWGYKFNYTVIQAFQLIAAISTAIGKIGPGDTAPPILAGFIDSGGKAISLCHPDIWNQSFAGRLGPPPQYLAAGEAVQAARRALAGNP